MGGSTFKPPALPEVADSLIAISSLYGIDILEDNVIYCRQRLYDYFNERYTRIFAEPCAVECCDSVKLILGRNIVWGDTLSMQTVSTKPEPILLSEWLVVNEKAIKRKDYLLSNLMQNKPADETNIVSGIDDGGFNANPIQEFPLRKALKLDQHD